MFKLAVELETEYFLFDNRLANIQQYTAAITSFQQNLEIVLVFQFLLKQIYSFKTDFFLKNQTKPLLIMTITDY